MVSRLDIRHRRDVLYILEDLLTFLLPYLVGMLIMAVIAIGGMWSTGYFLPPSPPVTFLQQHQSESLHLIEDLDVRSPYIVGGSLAALVLSFGYYKLH